MNITGILFIGVCVMLEGHTRYFDSRQGIFEIEQIRTRVFARTGQVRLTA